jgi:hypothetical protein
MGKMGVLNGFRRKLALLIDPDTARPPKIKRMPPARQLDDERAKFEAEFQTLLRRSGRASLLSGRISLINLAEIKESFHTSWSRVAERAERIARATIERHLQPGDIYTAVNELSFVIIFCSLSEDAANTKCLLIADRIRKALIGDQGNGQFDVRTRTSAVDESFRIAAVPPLDDLMRRAPREEAIGTADGEASRSASATLRDRSARRFAYRPMWHQARNVVSAYLCIDGESFSESPAANEAGAILNRDEAARERVLEDLAELIRAQRRLLLGVQVHFDTLASATRRREYAGALAWRLGNGAAELLIVEIVDAPPGVPQSRLFEIIASLRPYCRGVLVRLPIDAGEMKNLRGCGVTAVGCEIDSCGGSEHTVMQQINRFSHTAENAGFSTYLLGANSRSLVAAGVGAGFRYLGGDAVAEPVERPYHLVNFQLADLYRPFLQA